jgi:hypothetical protein
MERWEDRFFAQNRKSEVEFAGVPFEHVYRALAALGWTKDDEFWAPDLHVSRFVRPNEEIFVIHEAYFDLKITGTDRQADNLREFISGIEPDEVLCAGNHVRK